MGICPIISPYFSSQRSYFHWNKRWTGIPTLTEICIYQECNQTGGVIRNKPQGRRKLQSGISQYLGHCKPESIKRVNLPQLWFNQTYSFLAEKRSDPFYYAKQDQRMIIFFWKDWTHRILTLFIQKSVKDSNILPHTVCHFFLTFLTLNFPPQDPRF